MENPDRFDLNGAIASWSQHLRQSTACRSGDVEELESHLRDSVKTLAGAGLSEEEAFLVATRRAGSSHALETEFAKVNIREIWFDRLQWMLVGVLGWQLIGVLADALGRMASLLAVPRFTGGQPGRELDDSLIQWLPALLFFLLNLLALGAVLAMCWLVVRRLGPRLPAMLRSSQLGWTAAAVCLAILVGAALGRAGDALMTRVFFTSAAEAHVYGRIVVSSNLAGIAMSGVKTVMLALLMVLLARRNLRRAMV